MTIGSRRAFTPGNQLSNTQAAYLAGLIDGEGSIILNSRPSRRFAPHQANAMLSITNTNLEIINAAHSMLGTGQIAKHVNAEGWKDSYQIHLMSNSIRQILPQLQPYLIGKKRQAEMVLEYLSLVQGTRGIAEADRERAIALRQEVTRLNARGDDAKKELFKCVAAGCKQRAYEGHPYCYHHWLEYGEQEHGSCRRCGKDMPVRHPTKQYCSRKCYMAEYEQDVVKVRKDAERDAREKPPCPVCGTLVDRTKYARKIYCSDKCQNKAGNDRRPKIGQAREVADRPEGVSRNREFLSAAGLPRLSGKGAVEPRIVQCPSCKKEFESTHPRQLFCSRACRDKARSEGRYKHT